jgi:hypothetical protein
MTTEPTSPPVSPSKETKENGGGGNPLERNNTADSMDMRNMAKAAKSSGVEAAPRNKRRGGRRGAPERGRGSGASDKRAVIRCTTADSMDMKAMQNGLRAAPVSADHDDDVDDSERPPSPMLGGPPLSVGVLLDCEDHSASSFGDDE